MEKSVLQIRSLWIFDQSRLYLHRRYPSVEKKYKSENEKEEKALIRSSKQFMKLFLQRLKTKNHELSMNDGYAITNLPLDNHRLWPLVANMQNGYIFVVLPLVDSKMPEFHEDPKVFATNEALEVNLYEYPQITAAMEYLQELSTRFFNLLNQQLSQNPGKPLSQSSRDAIVNYLYMYTSQSTPFGTPIDTNLVTIHSLLTKPFPNKDPLIARRKMPAYKPHPIKVSPQQVVIVIRELVRSVQYDRKSIPNTWDIQGMIKCTADVEKYPDLMLVVSGTSCLKQLSKHESVHSMTPENWKAGDPLHLTVKPPVGTFNVLTYQLDRDQAAKKRTMMPIRGFYQMRYVASSHSVNILLQLKLESPFEMESATISMPFAYSIREFTQADTNVGSLSIAPYDDAVLLWKLDARCFSSSSEILCHERIHFHTKEVIHPEHLDGQHVKLSYRVNAASLSGLSVSHVTCTPPTKLKTKIQYAMLSTNSIIWNSCGACHHVPNMLAT